MGYMMVIGDCITCGRIFGFNPYLVPSVRVQGIREPVCRSCMDRANSIRKERGLELFTIEPGAYEPQEE